VYKDDALLELASAKPQTAEDLGRTRLLLREGRKGEISDGILAAVKAGLEARPEDLPKVDDGRDQPPVDSALADLLRVLLKSKSEASGVAQKLIATSGELDAIASGLRDVPALHGWRLEVFGDDALRLCDGEIALTARKGSVRVVKLPVKGVASAADGPA
jgi:ribonuclease D